MDGVHTREPGVTGYSHPVGIHSATFAFAQWSFVQKFWNGSLALHVKSPSMCSDTWIKIRWWNFPDSSFAKVVNQVVKKPTSEMELVDLEMYIEELLGWMLNIVDTVVLGRIW